MELSTWDGAINLGWSYQLGMELSTWDGAINLGWSIFVMVGLYPHITDVGG